MAMKIPIRDAVLHGNDDGAGPKKLRHFARHGFDLMRLHPQHDDVLSARLRIVVGRLDARHAFFGSIGVDQPDAPGAQRLKICSACNECDVFSGQRKPRSHIAADCTDSDNGYLQWRPPTKRGNPRPTC